MRRGALILLLILGSLDESIQANAQGLDPIEAVAPVFPLLPSGGRESGDVQVAIIVDAAGGVTSAQAISGPERLRRAAESAARKWRFPPGGHAQGATLTFGFNVVASADTSETAAVFKKPDRVDVFADQKKVITLADPAFGDVDKSKKKRNTR